MSRSPGERYHPDKYDEEAELTLYIWDHFRNLMTSIEKLTNKAISVDQKSQHASPELARKMRERWGSLEDPDIAEALKDGVEAFRRSVKDRVIQDSGDEVFINRCPECQRILTTPKARQCLWCGYDWH